MLDCKYCGGTGKLHDDADAFDDHERDICTALIQADRDMANARVAVLRSALTDVVERKDHDVSGRGQHVTSCHLCELETVLATLDPAATALLERLKAAEAVCEIADKQDGSMSGAVKLDEAVAAWRKVKGEP